MNIMLGNLSVENIEARAGITFPDDLKQLMRDTHQQEAENIADGRWHCFDIPFTLVCGGRPLAQKIYDHLKAESKNFKEVLGIALSQAGES